MVDDNNAPKTPEAARDEVMKCEQEIQSIKGALRKLGSSATNGEPNSLEIVMLKVEGLPTDAKPNLSIQMSSPIEEGIISELYDPLNCDPPPEGSVCVFRGVETSVATLTVVATDADINLGSSAPHDVSTLCILDDALNMKEKYETELPLAIIATDSLSSSSSSPTTTAATTTTTATDDDDDDKKEEETPVVAVVEEETTATTEEESATAATATATTAGEDTDELDTTITAKGQQIEVVAEEELAEDGGEEQKSENVIDETEGAVTEAEVVEITDEKEDTAATTSTTSDGEDDASATAVPIIPVCTIIVRVTYKPSQKDQREELYELLNKKSQKKAVALENLRQLATARAMGGSEKSADAATSSSSPSSSSTAQKSGQSSSSSPSTSSAGGSGVVVKKKNSPAVKAGFLNKNTQKESSGLQKLYERTLGPNSLFMRSAGILLIAKNYIIFFGAVAFFHFKGQMLSLPPPV